MFEDVNSKIKRKNKILFNRESASLQELKKAIDRQSRFTLVLWAFDCMKIPLKKLKTSYPNETDIEKAYDMSWKWARGEVKMPEAKKAILACHSVAGRLKSNYDIALCRAVGQGCSTVHVKTHALGLVFYELTAMVIENEYTDYEEEIKEKIEFYKERLAYWENKSEEFRNKYSWAKFL